MRLSTSVLLAVSLVMTGSAANAHNGEPLLEVRAMAERAASGQLLSVDTSGIENKYAGSEKSAVAHAVSRSTAESIGHVPETINLINELMNAHPESSSFSSASYLADITRLVQLGSSLQSSSGEKDPLGKLMGTSPSAVALKKLMKQQPVRRDVRAPAEDSTGSIGALPEFLELANRMHGSRTPSDEARFKNLGAQFAHEGHDMNKILGTTDEGSALQAIIKTGSIAGVKREAAPYEGQLPEFLRLSASFTGLGDLTKADQKDVARYKQLGASLMQGGTKMDKVLGTSNMASSLMSLMGVTASDLDSVLSPSALQIRSDKQVAPHANLSHKHKHHGHKGRVSRPHRQRSQSADEQAISENEIFEDEQKMTDEAMLQERSGARVHGGPSNDFSNNRDTNFKRTTDDGITDNPELAPADGTLEQGEADEREDKENEY